MGKRSRMLLEEAMGMLEAASAARHAKRLREPEREGEEGHAKQVASPQAA